MQLKLCLLIASLINVACFKVEKDPSSLLHVLADVAPMRMDKSVKHLKKDPPSLIELFADVAPMLMNESVESLKKDPSSFVELFADANPNVINQVIGLLDTLVSEADSTLQTLENNLNTANTELVSAQNALIAANTAKTNAEDAKTAAEDEHQIAQREKDDQSPKLNEEKRILREVIVQLQSLSAPTSPTSSPTSSQSPTGGCSDGSVEQVFQINTMVGCDGSYSRSSFRDACSSGWHVATASEYFKYGGKTVRPTQTRFVDVTWDSSGKETSLDNWQGYFDSSNSGGWDSLRKNSDCIWVSRDEQCTLSFVDHNYGSSYGCHCRGSDVQGVVCVKDSE